MKVKSFKLIPGVKHQGDDHETLHKDSQVEASNPAVPEPSIPLAFAATSTDSAAAATEDGLAQLPPLPGPVRPTRRTDTESRKFKDKFVLSVDGERYNPGHGIVCEVHQGLATFLADSKLRKYQPSTLLKPREDPARSEERRGEMQGAQERVLTWMREMEKQLKTFEDHDKESKQDDAF
jgi:hypothetical protein